MANAPDNKQIILDNRFFVPAGVIDVRAKGAEDGESNYIIGDQMVEGPILSNPVATIPMPPSSYQIVEQHVRITSDGRAVVDVMLEFPDIDGVETIDVRITKA
jgi:hypothetical protein